ncbi:MAG: hypothetical protein U5L01_03310 [Rheinheimera sp.]|nr:hypothetical protein [Rheinheimera sp.]
MKAAEMLTPELELTSHLLFCIKRAWLWLLVAAAAGALLGAVYVKQQTPLAVAKAQYTLAKSRIEHLATDYQQIKPGNQLLLGALEIDELARVGMLLEQPDVWQLIWQDAQFCNAFAAICQQDAKANYQQWRKRLQFEHRRRGNMLFVQVRAEQPELAKALLAALMRAVETRYQQHGVAQLTEQVTILQQTLAKSTTVGERSELAAQLDKNQAQLALWQAGAYRPTHAWTPEILVSEPGKKTLFIAVFAGLFSALLASLVAAVVVRR